MTERNEMPSGDYTVVAAGRDALGQPWEIGVKARGLVIAFPGAMFTVPGPEDGSRAIVPAYLLLEGSEGGRFTEAAARAITPGQTGQGALTEAAQSTETYKVEGKDGFDLEADYYPLSECADYSVAREAARARLAELNRSQPGAGGQSGIQDRVYIVHPDGRRERVFS